MYKGLKHLHNFVPSVLLTLLILAAGSSTIPNFKKNKHSEGHRKNVLVVLIVAHLQLIIGLILYFIITVSMKSITKINQLTQSISHRLCVIEHPKVMILSRVLISVAYSKSAKKATDPMKHKIKFYYLFPCIPFNFNENSLVRMAIV